MFLPNSLPGALWPLRSAFNILTGLVLLLLVVQLIENAGQRRRFVHILLASSLVVIAYAIFQVAFQYHLWLARFVQSTLIDKNSLGIYLVLMLGIWAGQWLAGGPRARFFLSILAGFLVVCLIAASVRAAWGAALVVLTALAWWSLRPVARPLRLKVAVGAGLLFVVLLAGLVYRAGQLNVKQDVSDDIVVNFWFTLNPHNSLHRILRARERIWLGALDAIADQPLLGIGIGRFYSSPYAVHRSGQWEHAHNYYLQIAAELGLAGLIVWLGLLAHWLSHLRRQLRVTSDEADRWTLFGIGLAIVAYLLTQVTSHALLLPVHQLLFWGMIGLGCTAFPAKPLSRRARWGLLILVVVLMVSLFFRHPIAQAPQPKTPRVPWIIRR